MNKTEFLKHRHFDVMFHGDEWKGTELFDKYEIEFAQYDHALNIYLIRIETIQMFYVANLMNKIC